jgi:hypothetical protein
MLNTIRKWFGGQTKPQQPKSFVYESPCPDWTDVISAVRKAEDAVLEYAKRTDLPLGVRRSFDMAVEQIKAGRTHDVMSLCRNSVHDPHYRPCCSHVTEALAAREPTTVQS